MRTRMWFTMAFVASVVAATTVGAASPAAVALGAKHSHRDPPRIVLHQRDNGRTVKARVGQLIDIVLGSPSPEWTVKVLNGNAVEYLGSSSTASGSATASITVYHFQAVEKGRADISIICEPPPWSMMPVRLLFHVTVKVR